MSETEFAELWSFTDQGSDGVVFDLFAVLKIDLKQLPAVGSEGNDGHVGELHAAIEFELKELVNRNLVEMLGHQPSSNAGSFEQQPRDHHLRHAGSL